MVSNNAIAHGTIGTAFSRAYLTLFTGLVNHALGNNCLSEATNSCVYWLFLDADLLHYVVLYEKTNSVWHFVSMF